MPRPFDLLLALLGIFAGCQPVIAQADTTRMAVAGWSWGIWAARATASPGGWPHWGKVRDRHLVQAGLHANRTLLQSYPLRLDYTVDLVPLSLVTASPREFEEPVDPEAIPESRHSASTDRSRWVWGVGITPFGIEPAILLGPTVRVFTRVGGGAVWFSRPAPEPHTSRFNFTFDAAVGVEFRLVRGNALAAGYRLHHFSNAGTAQFNPGLDAHLVFVEWRPSR